MLNDCSFIVEKDLTNPLDWCRTNVIHLSHEGEGDMRDSVVKGLRIEKMLESKTIDRATSVGLNWSEWVRQVLRKEVGLIKDKGK